MAKHVFSNTQEVCHAWANKTTDWGKNGSGSISFDGDVIYSYGTKMGKMCENTGYTLLNSGKYSITTSGQQSDIYNAIPYGMRSKCIFIDLSGYNRGHGANFDVATVIKSFSDEVQSICLKLAKARKKSKYCEQLDQTRVGVEKYKGYLLACKNLNLTSPDAFATDAEFAEVDALIKSFENYGDLELKAKAYLKEQAEREKARLETLRSEFETSLQEWREHKSDYVKHTYDFQDDCKTDFVRLSKDGKYFETHKNAKVPFNVGIQLFRVCANIKNKCVGYETEFKFPMQFRGTPFVLNEVKADGSCVVGCHRFSFSELNNMCKIAQPTLAFND